jgi:hypothetical protein
MKVIKAKDVPQTKTVSGEVNPNAIAELQEKFDAMKQMIDTKSYDIFLDPELSKFFFESFYPAIQWKGYESYAVSESFDRMMDIKQDDGSVRGKARPEIIEAVFHFIKSYMGSGIENARSFKRMADQFAITIQEINQDRQNLKDISLELVAAEKGITVESLTGELQKDPNFLDK